MRSPGGFREVLSLQFVDGSCVIAANGREYRLFNGRDVCGDLINHVEIFVDGVVENRMQDRDGAEFEEILCVFDPVEHPAHVAAGAMSTVTA